MYLTLIEATEKAKELAEDLKKTVYIGKKRADQFIVTEHAPASFKWNKLKIEFVQFVRPTR